MFGRDREEAGTGAADALSAEVERLAALPLAELAAEVMAKGFGAGSPGADDDAITVGGQNADAGPSAGRIADEFADAFQARGADAAVRRRLIRLVAEGLQQLEHASLVRAQVHSSSRSLDYAATRLGRAALDRGEVEQLVMAVAP